MENWVYQNIQYVLPLSRLYQIHLIAFLEVDQFFGLRINSLAENTANIHLQGDRVYPSVGPL